MFEPVLTKNVGNSDVLTLKGYKKTGGYEALAKALKMEPDAIIDKDKKPKYLVCNADESEPGTFKDRLLMEFDPHQLIEGCAICCWAVQANTCYIYIRGEYTRSTAILERALKEAYEDGLLGSSVMGSGFALDMYVHR